MTQNRQQSPERWLLFFVRERSINEQRAVCKSARCAERKAASEALHLSKAGAYNLLNADDFPTLKIGGRKLVMKQDLLLWLKKHTNGQEPGKTENSQ